MPSLFAFLAKSAIVLAVLASVAFGCMWALVAFVTVKQRRIEQVVPAERMVGRRTDRPVTADADRAPSPSVGVTPAVKR